MTIRSFISLELPEDIKMTIAALIAQLRTSGSDVAWLSAEKIHLTLKFLGAIDDALIPKIKESLSKKLSLSNPFYIRIVGVGCFPSEKRPRVILVGIENSENLNNLKKDLEAGVSEFGFAPEERPFSPHLTIGRVRSQKAIADMLRRFAEFRTTDFGTVGVRSIYIMKSELKPSGAEYTSIAEIPLDRGRKDVKGIEQRTE